MAALGVLHAGAGAGLSCGGAGPPPRPVAADPSGNFPDPTQVALYVVENKSYGQVIGNPAAPYLNRLAHRYALATQAYNPHYNPFVYYEAVRGTPKDRSRVVGFGLPALGYAGSPKTPLLAGLLKPGH